MYKYQSLTIPLPVNITNISQGLVDEHGSPQKLAGLVTHLYYKEPGNFVFVEMLENGCFHSLCKKEPEGMSDFKHT